MSTKNYNIMTGGLTTLIEDIKQLDNDIKKLNTKFLNELAKRLVQIIQEEASSISYNYEMYSAVYNGNSIIMGNDTVMIVNNTQAATYSEFGTGVVGSRSPNPDDRMGWQYDVNEHGDKGWVYPLGSGSFAWTKGVPSNPVFMRSAERLRTEIPEIAKRIYSIKGGGENE